MPQLNFRDVVHEGDAYFSLRQDTNGGSTRSPSEPPSVFHDTLVGEHLVDVPLPGQGKVSTGCNEDLLLYCGDCGHHYEVKSKCMKKSCPNCWRSWAASTARKSSLRLWAGVKKVMKGKGKPQKHYRILHATVSHRIKGLESIALFRKKTIKLLKAKGISGGWLTFHPIRKGVEDAWLPDGTVHFHCIGLAPGNVEGGGTKDCVFKVIEDAKRRDYRGFKRIREITSCMFYLLTHCGVVEKSHSITWFGCLSYNMLPNRTLEEFSPEMWEWINTKPVQICPECGSDQVFPLFDWVIESAMNNFGAAYG